MWCRLGCVDVGYLYVPVWLAYEEMLNLLRRQAWSRDFFWGGRRKGDAYVLECVGWVVDLGELFAGCGLKVRIFSLSHFFLSRSNV